jgi:catechol 2,3-dioxygenase-like lactoylglutathione lyase family enzyme
MKRCWKRAIAGIAALIIAAHVFAAEPERYSFSAPFEEQPMYRPGARSEVILGIDSVTLAVADLERTRNFYAQAAGLVPMGLAVPGSDVLESDTLRAPNVSIHLVEESGLRPSSAVHPVQEAGYSHLCYQSYREAPGYTRFKAAGASDVSRNAPVDLGGYGVTYAYLRDPDGAMLESEQLDFAKLAHEVPRQAEVWLSHFALTVENLPLMMGYYGKLLGQQPYRKIKSGPSPRLDEVADLPGVRAFGAWYNLGNLHIEFWHYHTPPTLPPRKRDGAGYRELSLQVADIDMTLSRLRAQGIAVPDAIEENTAGRFFYVIDPEGNRVRLIEFADPNSPYSVADIDYHRADFRRVE